ncbi:DegT/DnrJ/EryC1/StrS aminotransferase family protein [Yonghaparkia sp. Root332]|uniref:DegT/DnrJ/EryC1/StrS family aminotransferase n=1 Tax=Yonghaparkia sp. Root332 TaxID=1736516 RepID=UPI0006F3F58F|nr:aminotransferase class I/II-fold pyridoxal phosphate-dependent enzyme [Yonghaparkia sp. Root332]KQV25459.1 pyridoxal-5'-phosphate-dependent protein [Yonghaparkia sp. Root332]
MIDRIFLSSPDVGPEEEAALVRAIRSGWAAPLGPDVDAFEREVARFCDVEHAVALSSGTAALHLGLLALGVKRGDVVVTSTMTFAATANAIAYVGATPFFVDVDETGNMDPGLLEESLKTMRATADLPAAIIPVDLLGRAADYGRILPIAAEYGVPVLCDSAESLGAERDGRPAGSFGRASVLSFNGNKIMTTSGGGMLLSNEETLASRARHLATQARQPVPHYEHEEIGYNYRLSNLLAAMGRAQLGRLPGMIERRRSLRRRYRSLIEDFNGVTLFQGSEDEGDNCWLTAILVEEDSAGHTPESIRSSLDEQGIESRPLWKPMHQQPVFRGAPGLLTGVADRLFATGLALPSGSVLSAAAIDRVIEALGRALEGGRR